MTDFLDKLVPTHWLSSEMMRPGKKFVVNVVRVFALHIIYSVYKHANLYVQSRGKSAANRTYFRKFYGVRLA